MHTDTPPDQHRPIELLPPTQQLALHAANTAPLRFDGARQCYIGRDSTHPVRTVRAMARAGLVELSDGHAHLTAQGRELAGEGA